MGSGIADDLKYTFAFLNKFLCCLIFKALCLSYKYVLSTYCYLSAEVLAAGSLHSLGRQMGLFPPPGKGEEGMSRGGAGAAVAESGQTEQGLA